MFPIAGKFGVFGFGTSYSSFYHETGYTGRRAVSCTVAGSPVSCQSSEEVARVAGISGSGFIVS